MTSFCAQALNFNAQTLCNLGEGNLKNYSSYYSSVDPEALISFTWRSIMDQKSCISFCTQAYKFRAQTLRDCVQVQTVLVSYPRKESDLKAC